MKNIWIGGCNDRIWAGGEWGGGGGGKYQKMGRVKLDSGRDHLVLLWE